MSDGDAERGPTKVGEDGDGELVVMQWPDGGVEQSLQAQISSTPQAGGTSSRRRGDDETGPIQRTTATSSLWQSVDLRSFALNSTELSTTLKRFRDEMYLNQFPVLLPAFVERCLDCGTEFDEERETCPVCGHDGFEPPSREQKHWLADLVERVNDDGQSLRTLLKYEEDFQSFFGVSTLLVRLDYQHTRSTVRVADQTVDRAPTARWEPTDISEIVHADPRQLVPVTDEQNRHGGWWTCPGHRDQYWEADTLTFETDAGHPVEVCPECEARLEEVGYVELSGPRSQDAEQLFLKHEVIDWARHFPVLNGLDGRAPVLPLIKLQAILQYSRNYELQYLSPQNDQQLPDKFLVAYGKNIQENLSASLNQEESKNPWEEGRLTYNGNPDDVEVEILDLSSTGINGREPMIERLMSQVRAMFGMTDAFENELSDAGGLNAEGTQVEITNHAVASAHQDTKDQALDSLCRIIAMIQGSCDWELGYVDPERAEGSLSPVEVLNGIATAQEAGVSVSVEDGALHIPDQQIDAATSPDSPAPDSDQPAAGQPEQPDSPDTQ